MNRFIITYPGDYNASFSSAFNQQHTLDGPRQYVMLISEQWFREQIYVSDSINSKLLLTTIRETQDTDLATVIGTDFLTAIQIVLDYDVDNEDIKVLVDKYIRPFLLYQTAATVLRKMNIHPSNKGQVKDADVTDQKDMINYYNSVAGSHLRRLTDFLTQNYSTYSKYLTSTNEIHANTSASYDTGIFLGCSPKRGSYPVDEGWRR